jgi:type VI protein secretion system component Hcp
VRKAGRDQLEYLKIAFSDVVVTSFEQAGDQEPPREAVSLAFDRIEIEYSQPAPKGRPVRRSRRLGSLTGQGALIRAAQLGCDPPGSIGAGNL